MFYAQLNGEKICVGISQLSGEVIDDNMIELEDFDTSLLGKKYNDGVWEDVPIPNPESIESEPSQLDRIETALNQSQQEMIDREIDRYTLDLIEQGFL